MPDKAEETVASSADNPGTTKSTKPRKPRKLSQYVCVTRAQLEALPQQRETVKNNLLDKLQKQGEDGVEYVILREVASVKVQATTTRKLKAT